MRSNTVPAAFMLAVLLAACSDEAGRAHVSDAETDAAPRSERDAGTEPVRDASSPPDAAPEAMDAGDGLAAVPEGGAPDDSGQVAAPPGAHEPAPPDDTSTSPDDAATADDAGTTDDAGSMPAANSGHGHVAGPPLAGEAGFQLPFHIVDAEYSAVLDRIVIASDEPNRVVALDGETGDYSEVLLPLTPLAVSVDPSGLLAAIGHDRFVSVVELEPPRLVATIPISTNAGDVVFAGNGYAYAFARSSSWTAINSIETGAGIETLGTMSVYGGTVARLHPLGDRMYGADRGISPADLERYDIAGGVAVVAYDSPYHGQYGPCGNLWFTQAGERILTACGGAFHASDVRAQDMTYAGALEGNPRVEHLDHSQTAGWVVAVHSGMIRLPGRAEPVGRRELSFFDDAFLGWRQSVTLPRFVVSGREYAAEGRFAFFNRAGDRLYALVRAEPLAPLADDFGLARYTVDARAGGGLPIPPAPAADPPLPPVTAAQGTVLDFDVIDAEYSRVLDRIVAVRRHPDQVVLMDPVSGGRLTVDLPLAPTAVALHLDGMQAVVGHDGWVSAVDLVQRRVSNTRRVPAVVGELAAPPNGRAYAIPSLNQFVPIYMVSLQDEAVPVASFSVDGGSRARLHPGGAAMYVTSSSLQRYDIASDGALSRRETPDRTVSACATLTLSDDGTRIFTGCGNVFRASSVPAEDMTFIAALEGMPLATHLDHSAAAGLLALARTKTASSNPTPGQLQLFHDDTLSVAATLSLPSVTAATRTYQTTGRFVFFDQDGAALHVLAQADGPAERRSFVLLSLAVQDLTLAP